MTNKLQKDDPPTVEIFFALWSESDSWENDYEEALCKLAEVDPQRMSNRSFDEICNGAFRRAGKIMKRYDRAKELYEEIRKLC